MIAEHFVTPEQSPFRFNPTPAQKEFMDKRIRFVDKNVVYAFNGHGLALQPVRTLPDGLYQAPDRREGKAIPQFWTQPLIDHVFDDAQKQSQEWKDPTDQTQSSMYDHAMALMLSLRMEDQSSVDISQRYDRLDVFNAVTLAYMTRKQPDTDVDVSRALQAWTEVETEVMNKKDSLTNNQLLDRWVQLMLLASITTSCPSDMSQRLEHIHKQITETVQSRVTMSDMSTVGAASYMVRSGDEMIRDTRIQVPAAEAVIAAPEKPAPQPTSFYTDHGLNLSEPTLRMITSSPTLNQSQICQLARDALFLNLDDERFTPEERLHERMYIHAMAVIAMHRSQDENLRYPNYVNSLSQFTDIARQFITARQHPSPLERAEIEKIRRETRSMLTSNDVVYDLKALVQISMRLVPLTIEAIDSSRDLFYELSLIYEKLREKARQNNATDDPLDKAIRLHFRYAYEVFRQGYLTTILPPGTSELKPLGEDGMQAMSLDQL